MTRPLPGRPLATRFAAGLIRRDLRRTFRRAVWVGPRPWEVGALSLDRPVVLYANHHYFHDSYLLWHLTTEVLGRSFIVWMRDWARAPIFAPIGALPFPADDPARRLATMRETARRLRDAPRTVFLYYPEGEMAPPDRGVAGFEVERFARLARLLPDTTLWWPVGVRLTWWGEDRPTALLAAGDPHEAPDGREAERLEAVLARLKEASPPPEEAATLFEGHRSPHERWDLSPLAPLFARWM